jgi:uncharacterized membrane protein YkgB
MINELDHRLIHFFKKISIPLARFALFVVFFWFGFLKVIGLSPAGPLVHSLFDQTINFMPFDTFYILFALLECLIGILFLVKGAERIVLPLLLFHMITTFLPLIFLPDVVWQKAFVPTLEGQYIIKNLVIIATAIGLVAHLHPLPKKV